MPRPASILLAVMLAAPLALSGAPVQAQDLPADPRAAQELLQRDPALQRRIADAIANSGMTQEQLRARLRAAGYDESLLDGYLAVPGQGRQGMQAMTGLRGELDAVRELGLVAETEADSLLSLIDSM